MLNHSSPPPAHHLATIVLQDAGCTIVDLPEQRERRGGKRRREEEERRRGDRETCYHGNRAGAHLTSKRREGGREEIGENLYYCFILL